MALLGLALAGLGPGTARTGAAARGLVLVQAGAPGGLEARREAIQRLRIARQVGLGSYSRAAPALIQLVREAPEPDLGQRAAQLMVQGLVLEPGAEVLGLDGALRQTWLRSEDPQLRSHALLLLLARQGPELPGDHRGALLAEILPAVLVASREQGLPPSVTLAQAILESGWGRSRLARRHHNLFGIKAGRAQPGVDMMTREHAGDGVRRISSRFRSFDSIEQSIHGHARLLGQDPRYENARAQQATWPEFLAELAPVYATDPHYEARITHLVQRYQLDRWDGLVREAWVWDRLGQSAR